VRVFTATILTDNRTALDLAKSLGDSRRVGALSSTTELEMELPQLGMGERLRDALRHAAAGVWSGRDPSHPRTSLRSRS
jgi:hypothetical protein